MWNSALSNEKSSTFVCLKPHVVCFLGGCMIIPLAVVKIRVSSFSVLFVSIVRACPGLETF